MRLKSFYAKNVTEAMQMVRDSLGDDAVIVATREEQGGATVRVTAAVEQEDNYGAASAATEAAIRNRGRQREANFSDEEDAKDWITEDDNDAESAVVEQLTDAMLRHAVPDEITDQVISCAAVLGLNDALQALTEALEHLYAFKPLPQKIDGGALMMVGPPGAGKTLAVAKLAARAVLAGKKATVISTDTVRAGGIEQLSAFTKLMRIELKRAATPNDLRAALEDAERGSLVFIDSSGLNPFSADDMRGLARLSAAGDIEPVLVLPAGLDAEESGEMARIYATLGARSMISARLDIARRLGGLLSAAHHGSMIFAEASRTPKVADGLITLSPQKLATLLLPQAVKKSQPRQTTPSKKLARTG